MHAASHQYGNLHACNSNVLQGDIHIHGPIWGSDQERAKIFHYGLCLGSAPVISPGDFVGRTAELEQMKRVLRPGEKAIEQQRLVLGGMGGIGKTQLAIAYARYCHASYTSVFWLNASTELTLKGSIQLVARQLIQAAELQKLSSEQIVLRAHQLLSDIRNTQWLLIFDNYDDPSLYNIDTYIPDTANGAAVITSRLPDRVKGRQIRVQPMEDLKESLKILQTRSQRYSVENGRSYSLW